MIEDGIVARPSDLDVIWVTGFGWPKHLGGPMFYADITGLEKILSSIESFEQRFGKDWQPSSLLQKLVKENKNFRTLNETVIP